MDRTLHQSGGIFGGKVTIDDHLFPIGTAFTVGKTVRFLLTAEHTIAEAIKHEPVLDRLRTEGRLPAQADIKRAQLCVLYQRKGADDSIEFMIWPIEHVNGAPPTDVVFAYPKFVEGFPTLATPLSFGLPSHGARVFSVGYVVEKVPADGISLAEVKAGRFDWRQDYSHRLCVVEGVVERIFTQRFARGFVDGPCFLFDQEIDHGLSGGPVFTMDGFVCGVNTAGAALYFDAGKSLASLLYPLLPIHLKASAQVGGLHLQFERPLLEYIASGSIRTDGSEQHLGIHHEQDGSFIVSPRCTPELLPYCHDDFSGFQSNTPASTTDSPHHVVRFTEPH
ncbi:MAG: hypothetical protein AB7L90_25370 [Hyphomicrobiaceae bacterium]